MNFDSLRVVQRMRDFLTELQRRQSLTARAAYSLGKDITYLEKCVGVLSGNDPDSVNDLWREVQYLSRFFGEGYAVAEDQQRLQQLMEEFESALLDDIVVLRSKR